MNRKRLWAGIAVLAVLVAGIFIYLNLRTRSLSPRGEEKLTSGGVTVSVTYSRPSVRGRLIFGPKEQNALQPFGQYWRLGANEATEITFNRDILFNNRSVKGGSYRMYAIPDADHFDIALNADLGKSGSEEPDSSKDVLRTRVATEKTGAPVEQFTISLAPEGDGINMVFEWSDTRFVVPLRAESGK
jgi:hypothetical protein